MENEHCIHCQPSNDFERHIMQLLDLQTELVKIESMDIRSRAAQDRISEVITDTKTYRTEVHVSGLTLPFPQYVHLTEAIFRLIERLEHLQPILET